MFKNPVLYKTLVIGIVIFFIGVIVVPSICGFYNKSNVQFEKKVPANLPLNDGLLAYWKLDECTGGTVGDSSGNNYNGTLYGATWIGEYPDCALEFDGMNDYVDFDIHSENLGLNKTDDYIITLPEFKSTSSGGMIYSMSHTDPARVYVNFKLNANGTFSVHMGNETCSLELYTMCSYNDGNWHGVKVKYYGDISEPTLEIYVDDELDGSVTKWLPPFFNYDFKTAKMGRKSSEEIDYYDGVVYEVKIYKWSTNPPSPCPINITVHEAWELLNDTSNGIQIPIDIRSEEEWNESHIDTPWPENPIWFGDIQNFMEEFDGKEVIIYCEGGYRSLLFCYGLCGAGFNGTVYNMIGGFTAWKEAGYPITNNTPPGTPEIEGKRRFKAGEGGIYPYTIYSTDPDGDAVCYLINWSDGNYEWTGFYESGEEVTINVTIPSEKGTYVLFKIKAIDSYGAESNWAVLEVTVPRNKATHNFWFQLLLDCSSLLEEFLRIINVLR